MIRAAEALARDEPLIFAAEGIAFAGPEVGDIL